MFALLLALLVAAGPSVTMKVTIQSGPQNVHIHYTVVGPYEGRVCVDVDTTADQHAAAFCADESVKLAAGETAEVDESLHGPNGDWKMAPVLPDTPGDAPAIVGTYQTIHVEPLKSAERQ